MSNITDLFNAPSSNPAANMPSSFVLGVVTENNDDDHKGMVKVSFTAWNSKKNVYEWIPVLTAYGGKEHGFYIQPEVEDIVIVGFVGPGMKTPFVMGSLYSSNSSMLSESAEKKNMNRRLKTKGGIIAELSDESGKEAIRLTTPKEMMVTLEDEKQVITISDKNGSNALVIDCQGGKVTLDAKTSITFAVGQSKLTIDTSSISLSANKCDIAAVQTATMDGKQSTTVSGTTVTVEGKASAKVTSTGVMEVSGSIVKIN